MTTQITEPKKLSLANTPVPDGLSKAAFIAQEQSAYLTKLQAVAPQIQDTFQKTLNDGFFGLFITIGIFAFVALIFTLFLSNKEKTLKNLPETSTNS